MRNQRQCSPPPFCPKRQTKSSRPQKNGLMKKSRKEFKITQMHMKQPMNRNIEIHRRNLVLGAANPCQTKGRNVKRRSRTLITNGSTHSAKSARKSSQHSNGIESLHPTQLKAMPSLVHKENDRLNQYKNSLPSGVEEFEAEIFSGTEKKLIIYRSEANIMCYGNNMQEGNLKAKETPSSTSSVNVNQLIDEDTRRSSENKPTRMFGRDISNSQRDKTPFMKDSNCALPSKLFDRGQFASCDNKTSNGKPKRSGPWLEGTSNKNDDSHSKGVVQLANQTSRPTKKQRRLVITEDGDEQVIGGIKDDHNHVFVEDGTTGSKPQDPIFNHCHDKVPISLSIEKQCRLCSKPIDEPIWRGLIKICGNKYISMDGHLSTICGKKVWDLSRSLLPVVGVTKHPRAEVWSKRWETSKPNGNGIGIYFFPHQKRPNEVFDQLVKEVIENDLVLRAVIGEAEMLIFPSILLPKRYQTFQTKYYLWGVFKPREDKGVVIAERVNATRLCAKEVEKEIDDISSQKDVPTMKTPISWESHRLPAKSTQEVRASHVQEPSSRDLEHKAPKEDRQGDAVHHDRHTAIANPLGVDDPIISSNDVPVNPHTRLSPSTIYGFAVARTPKVMQLIREMEHEGAVVVALQGR